MNALVEVFIISLLSGLATGIGGLIAIIKKPGKKSFGFLMGLTAGVMLTLAFLELVNEALLLSNYLITTIGFGLGALFMFLVEYFIPHECLPFNGKEHNYHPKLFKTGILAAIGITIHNIPEGIVTVLPLCKSGVSKSKAVGIALLSGLVEPIGAMIAALFLVPFDSLLPYALAFAAGVMVFITLDEIVPIAREFGQKHFTAIGTIIGSIFVFILSGFFGI